jgi:ABC-type oligopeptide transport system ATPase subunit
LDSYLVEALPTDVLSVPPLPAANNTCLKYVSKFILLIEWWSKAFVSKHNWITNFAGLSRIGSSVLVAFNFMKMSSQGTSVACNNSNVNNNREVYVSSTEKFYSSITVPQSEILNSKQTRHIKFAKNKRARRQEKLKNMRKNGNQSNVPKSDLKKSPLLQPKIDYVHQSLVEKLYPASIIDLAKDKLVAMKAEAHTSKLMEVLEVVGALAITLPALQTPAQVAAQIVLSLRALTTGSLCDQILAQDDTIRWCKDLFGYNIFEQQSSIFGENMSTGVEWLRKVPDLRENWDSVRNAPVFGKISALISVAASVGLCSVTNLKWSVQGVDLFRVGTVPKHSTAIDLVGAVLDTVVYFIEGGYECFKQRSFSPLFFTNDDSRMLDELYFPLLELHEHAMVFNLHQKRVTIKGELKTIRDIEYSQLLDEAIELSERLFKSAKGTWQQGYLEKRIDVLRKNRAAYQAKRIDGSMRFAPFTVYIWGESGCGKSTIAQIAMVDCLSASGTDPSTKNTAVIKESDKYDSTLKGHTTGIFFDDLGNTKSDFLDRSPTERIIDINNNMITYANKADLHEKGKIEIRPRMFVITSNAPLATHANTGSICPFSIVRRADVHIEVEVKDEFAFRDGRLNSAKAFDAFPGDSLVTDVWNLQLYTPMHKDKGGDSSHLRHIDGLTEHRSRSILETLRILTTKCKKHFENQRRLISKSEGLVASRKYCKTCYLAHDLCECEPIAEDELEISVSDASDVDDDDLEFASDEEGEQQASLEESFDFIKDQFESMGAHVSNFVGKFPTWLYTNRLVSRAYVLCNARRFLTFEKKARRGVSFSTLLFLIACSRKRKTNTLMCGGIVLSSHALVYGGLLAKWRNDRMNELLSRRDATIDVFRSIRESKTKAFVKMCAIAGIIYKFTGIFRTAVALQQSALVPENVEEIEKRDAEANPWATAVAAELHVTDKSATMTFDQILSKVEANLCHGVFVENGFQQKCDVLALGGNTFMMPLHVFKNRKDMRALLTRKDPSELNSTFKVIVSTNYMIPIPGKDLCLVNIASGGVFADIRHLFPDKITASGSGHFLYKNGDGSMRSDSIHITYTKDSKSGGAGFDYELPYNTFTGLCMGVVVANFARKCIGGVHLRGIPDSPKGKALTVTQKEIQDVWDQAHKTWKGAFPSTVNGDFPTTRYERQVLVTQDIHEKSPVNYLPVGSNVEYLGQDGRRVTHTKSKVRKTPISDTVAEVTGVENQHGAPKFHRTRMWQASLAHSANPSAGIEGSLIEAAYKDYVDGLISVFKCDKFKLWVLSELAPMTDMEILCGKDGKRFIDAMPKGTSKGYPLSGPKREMIELLDPLDYPDFQCPAKAHPMIVDEMRKMEKILLSGKRCYSIFKACVKDEPTKLTKDKVRVFQAADWATQMLVRKYFLPLARILSLFPLDSECAVGVNAQGPEWDQLANHMKKHGADRILAGDYSKYDLRMPAQLINAAFAVLIEIAEKCGRYTEDDLIIMRGIATEVAYSCVAYNGDIIIHKGSNPSGQNLTVYINSIVNSLQLRCAYFHLWPSHLGKPKPFREICAIMTYGDDVKGSVKKGYDWFNHISCAEFFRVRDMVFTMPDKESEPTPYMNDLEADFLKRENKFNADTGMIHGALAEESIFKCLHNVLESKVDSLEDQSAKNIDVALREWWQHGKEVYELRRKQMKEVAFKCGITGSCKMLTNSYEDRLKYFEIRYLGREPDVVDEIADEDAFVYAVGDEWDFLE